MKKKNQFILDIPYVYKITALLSKEFENKSVMSQNFSNYDGISLRYYFKYV